MQYSLNIKNLFFRIQLLNKEVKPPFTPSVSGEDDTSQFDSYQDIKMIPSKDCKFKEEFEDF